MDYFKSHPDSNINKSDIIQIVYDIQAGQYINKTIKNPEWTNEYSAALAKIIGKLDGVYCFLEAGVGEGTTMYHVLSKLDSIPESIYGFDLSYSRLRYARHYMMTKNMNFEFMYMADIFNSSMLDNSIDLVFSSHALEPNGGREEAALVELHRIARKYIVLFEPSYELGNEKSKQHISKNGYVTSLYKTAIKLGFNVIEHKLIFDEHPLFTK